MEALSMKDLVGHLDDIEVTSVTEEDIDERVSTKSVSRISLVHSNSSNSPPISYSKIPLDHALVDPKKVKNTLKSLPDMYKHLWSISLCGCQLNEDALLPLSHYSALGFLDLSYTNIDILMLQRVLRPVRLLRCHLVGSSNIPVEDKRVRGFVLFSMPNMWSLNNRVTLAEERQYWTQYFLQGKGKFHDFMRRGYFVKFDSLGGGLTSRTKPMVARGPGGTHTLATKSLRTSDHPDIQPASLWNDWSHELLSKMPVSFSMGGEESTWRLEKLLMELERLVKGPSGSISSLLSCPTEMRLVLLLIIYGSIMNDFPHILLQKCLEYTHVFNMPSNQVNPSLLWIKHPTSPLLWTPSQKMMLMSILVASLTMDLTDDREIHSCHRTSLECVNTIQSNLSLFTDMHYSHLKHTQHSTQLDIQHPLSRFDPKFKDILQYAQSFISDSQHTCLTHHASVIRLLQQSSNCCLQLVQCICLIPEDVLFLRNFDKLEAMYSLCVQTLASHLETRLCTEKEYQDIKEILANKETSPRMSVDAAALDLKFRTCLSIQKAMETLV